MEERRDPAIKLFGKMIPLQGSGEDSFGAGEDQENKLQRVSPEKSDARGPGIPRPTDSEDSAKPEAKDAEVEKGGEKAENDEKQRKPNGDQEEEKPAAKKPDKIVACPRCDSLDTKFCYFNNYNVGQPRHFCKSCQRYWTAGGSLRNVPVGAGRRRSNKPPSPCYPRANLIPTHPTATTTTTTTTVLSFGSGSPLCESMASVLNLANAFESCEDRNSSQSSATGSSSTTDDGAGTAPAAAAPIPCVNGLPWAYPISPAGSAFAFPLYPAVAYWGYTVPFHSPQHNSPALGKHSREGDDDKLDDTDSEKSREEKRFWIPKTLRIDDPEDAAKSSIWATIGFKNEKSSATCGDGLFKPFRSKDDGTKSASELSQALQANPAAFARSMNFRESS